MSGLHRWIFVVLVALLGAGAGWAIWSTFAAGDEEGVALFLGVMTTLPATLAALPRKTALLLGLIAIGLGLVWMASVFSLPGDGAIGGFIVAAIVAAFAAILAAIVGIGTLLDRWAARRTG